MMMMVVDGNNHGMNDGNNMHDGKIMAQDGTKRGKNGVFGGEK